METVRVRTPDGGPWLEKKLMFYGTVNGRFVVNINDGPNSMGILVPAELVHPDDLKLLQEKSEKKP